MDHTHRPWDTDYTRHVKNLEKWRSQQEAVQDAERRRVDIPAEEKLEHFAWLLGIAAGLGAGAFMYLSYPAMPWWVIGLVALAVTGAAGRFFTRFVWVTKLIAAFCGLGVIYILFKIAEIYGG